MFKIRILKKLGIIIGALLLIILIFSGINTIINGNYGSNMRTKSILYNSNVRKIFINEDVPIKFRKGRHPRVIYHVNKDRVLNIKDNNRALNITNSSHHNLISFIENYIKFGGGSNNESITIILPKENNHISTITSHQDANDLSLSNLNMKNMNLSTDAGDIDLSHLKAKNMIVNSSSGDINLLRSKAKVMHVNTDAGDVHVSKLLAKKLHVDTSSGDIHLSNMKVNSLFHRTDAGDVYTHDLHVNKEN